MMDRRGSSNAKLLFKYCISQTHLVFKLGPDSAYGLQLTTPGLWWAQDVDESLKIQDKDTRP